jgi:thermitase
MKWTFRLNGEAVTLKRVDGVVAVKPSERLRAKESRARLTERFGAVAKDDSQGLKFGIDLPARPRRIFERAGWLFVMPRPSVERAALMHTGTRGAQAVRHVFIDDDGRLLVERSLLTVQLDPEFSSAQAERRLLRDGLTVVRRLSFATNTFIARLPDKASPPEVIAALQSTSDYVFAEPSFLQVITGRARPTDPEYAKQWQFADPQAGISAEAAWDITRGRGQQRPVRIAVIDNGMDINHPDLKGAVTGGGYFKEVGDGDADYVPFKPGMVSFPRGQNSHGTFCMGMAGARWNNGNCGCGIAPEADLFAVACLHDAVGTQATLARAVAVAADPRHEVANAPANSGADVITCSLGPDSPNWQMETVLRQAITFAAERGRAGLGVPIFWAVSNHDVPISGDKVCSHRDVIAVGSSTRANSSDGTAHGPKLELLAPGRNVLSLTTANNCGTKTGTSYAAPLAAGVAALVLSVHPSWRRDQVRARLRECCDKIGSPEVVYHPNGHNDKYGYGRINAAAAVRGCPPIS